MSVARHPRPKELEGVPVEEIMKRYVGRFKEKTPDWAAFEDAKIEGYRRAQHRFIGAGGSGKHGDPGDASVEHPDLEVLTGTHDRGRQERGQGRGDRENRRHAHQRQDRRGERGPSGPEEPEGHAHSGAGQHEHPPLHLSTLRD